MSLSLTNDRVGLQIRNYMEHNIELPTGKEQRRVGVRWVDENPDSMHPFIYRHILYS